MCIKKKILTSNFTSLNVLFYSVDSYFAVGGHLIVLTSTELEQEYYKQLWQTFTVGMLKVSIWKEAYIIQRLTEFINQQKENDKTVVCIKILFNCLNFNMWILGYLEMPR